MIAFTRPEETVLAIPFNFGPGSQADVHPSAGACQVFTEGNIPSQPKKSRMKINSHQFWGTKNADEKSIPWDTPVSLTRTS